MQDNAISHSAGNIYEYLNKWVSKAFSIDKVAGLFARP